MRLSFDECLDLVIGAPSVHGLREIVGRAGFAKIEAQLDSDAKLLTQLALLRAAAVVAEKDEV